MVYTGGSAAEGAVADVTLPVAGSHGPTCAVPTFSLREKRIEGAFLHACSACTLALCPSPPLVLDLCTSPPLCSVSPPVESLADPSPLTLFARFPPTTVCLIAFCTFAMFPSRSSQLA